MPRSATSSSKSDVVLTPGEKQYSIPSRAVIWNQIAASPAPPSESTLSRNPPASIFYNLKHFLGSVCQVRLNPGAVRPQSRIPASARAGLSSFNLLTIGSASEVEDCFSEPEADFARDIFCRSLPPATEFFISGIPVRVQFTLAPFPLQNASTRTFLISCLSSPSVTSPLVPAFPFPAFPIHLD